MSSYAARQVRTHNDDDRVRTRCHHRARVCTVMRVDRLHVHMSSASTLSASSSTSSVSSTQQRRVLEDVAQPAGSPRAGCAHVICGVFFDVIAIVTQPVIVVIRQTSTSSRRARRSE
jgi:hypothetical protein